MTSTWASTSSIFVSSCCAVECQASVAQASPFAGMASLQSCESALDGQARLFWLALLRSYAATGMALASRSD